MRVPSILEGTFDSSSILFINNPIMGEGVPSAKTGKLNHLQQAFLFLEIEC